MVAVERVDAPLGNRQVERHIPRVVGPAVEVLAVEGDADRLGPVYAKA